MEQVHGAATEFSSIPVIDMQPFVRWWRSQVVEQSGAPSAALSPEAEAEAASAAATAEEVGRACREVGFMVLTHTGISDELMDGAMVTAQRFFAAPAAHKLTASNAGDRCYRGFETMEGKEAWEMGLELPEEQDALPLHGPNRWPAAEYDGGAFRETMEGYYAEAVGFARCLLGALCMSLGLPPQLVRSQAQPHSTTVSPGMRLTKNAWRYRCSPRPTPPSPTSGCGGTSRRAPRGACRSTQTTASSRCCCRTGAEDFKPG